MPFVVGMQESADFRLYQVEWERHRIGIYAGDFPDYDETGANDYPITIDPKAKLKMDDQQGAMLIRMGKNSLAICISPGPASRCKNCTVGELANLLRAHRENGS